jgi:23S rRNA pseudouridine1911/1915/1917 synthase
MGERLEADGPEALLAFLKRRLDGWRVKTLRERLRQGCVRVDGERVERPDHPLQGGERVEVDDRAAQPAPVRAAGGIATLHVDEDLVAIDKPAGLLAVSTDRQRTRTALALVRDALSRPGARPAGLWPVHRLDRETSGVLLFARSRDVQRELQAGWSAARKHYLAVVDGHPSPARGLVDEPLWEDEALNVPDSHFDDTRPRIKLAIDVNFQRHLLMPGVGKPKVLTISHRRPH